MIAISYLTTPLPPPKASFKFQAFTVRGTNVYAIMHLKNEGRKIIWPDPRGQVEAMIEQNGGWITNREREDYGEVSTPFLTNQPPTGLLPSSKSEP